MHLHVLKVQDPTLNVQHTNVKLLLFVPYTHTTHRIGLLCAHIAPILDRIRDRSSGVHVTILRSTLSKNTFASDSLVMLHGYI